MIVITDTLTINIKMSLNDAFKIIIDYSRVTLQIVAFLADNSIGIIYGYNMLIVHAISLAQ